MRTDSFDPLAAALRQIEALVDEAHSMRLRLDDLHALVVAEISRREERRRQDVLHFPPPKPIQIDESPWSARAAEEEPLQRDGRGIPRATEPGR